MVQGSCHKGLSKIVGFPMDLWTGRFLRLGISDNDGGLGVGDKASTSDVVWSVRDIRTGFEASHE